MSNPTPQQVLDLSMRENDAGAATIRDYLLALLDRLWTQGSDFSSKKAFGGTDWQWVVYEELAKAGWVNGIWSPEDADGEKHLENVDHKAADRLIASAIRAFGNRATIETLRFTASATYTADRSGIHHFGCLPGIGMHHEDDCPRGLRVGLATDVNGAPVPISFVAGLESGLVVRSGVAKTTDTDAPTYITGLMWAEGQDSPQ